MRKDERGNYPDYAIWQMRAASGAGYHVANGG